MTMSDAERESTSVAMTKAIIQKESLKAVAAAVQKDGTLYGPVETTSHAGPDVVLAAVGADGSMVFDYKNFKLPPKRLFFPACEGLGECTEHDLSEDPSRKTVILGMRPCDAMALTYTDKVFLEAGCVDPSYSARRENTLIISLACKSACDNCFCTSVDCGPACKDGSDILAHDLGDSLLLESVTDKGKAFMAENGKLLSDAADQDAPPAADTGKQLLDLKDINARMQAVFESPIWDSMAERCLSCGSCTLLCPTCHCFAIFDGGTADEPKRVRAHDTCQFASFTSEASGHNPRARVGDRMRQRIMHKFSYVKDNYDDLFCVGCGRCVQGCPVNIDIREVLSEVNG